MALLTLFEQLLDLLSGSRAAARSLSQRSAGRVCRAARQSTNPRSSSIKALVGARIERGNWPHHKESRTRDDKQAAGSPAEFPPLPDVAKDLIYIFIIQRVRLFAMIYLAGFA